MQDLKQSLIQWNNTFPYDKLFRQKYGIAFGSTIHRETNQIDVYLDILEDKLFDRYRKEQNEISVLRERFEKEGFINSEKSQPSIEEMDDIWDKIDVDVINKQESDNDV